MSEVSLLTLEEVAQKLRTNQLSPTQVLESVLERAGRLNSTLGCFVTVFEEQARRTVAQLERTPPAERPPLWGVPISVKDNIDVEGIPTTAGSVVRRGHVALRDADAVARLRAAGGVVFAKASLYEFAFGAANPSFATTRNPWALDRSTGGSSSGSVSALAGRIGYASVGTDTGGSIRVPSGFCGVVGLKPTFGSVSTDGVVPVAWSLDHVGPITRTVRDCALVYNAMVSPEAVQVSLAELERGVEGLRVGVGLVDDDLDPEVRASLDVALGILAGEGASLTRLDLPDMHAARWCLWVISSAEAADYHREELRTRGGDYHPLVRRRLLRGRLLPRCRLRAGSTAAPTVVRAADSFLGELRRACVATLTCGRIRPSRSERQSARRRRRCVVGGDQIHTAVQPHRLAGTGGSLWTYDETAPSRDADCRSAGP